MALALYVQQIEVLAGYRARITDEYGQQIVIFYVRIGAIFSGVIPSEAQGPLWKVFRGKYRKFILIDEAKPTNEGKPKDTGELIELVSEKWDDPWL